VTTTNRTHSHSAKKALIALAASAVVGTVGAGAAEARGVEDCQLAWGQAVRSYLTQNRTKGPEDVVFRPACTIESQGDKAKARVEAVVIGVQALVKLDAKGCARFLESYVEAREPQAICNKAQQTPDDVDGLRRLVETSIPSKR
jgi:hypothetical protein